MGKNNWKCRKANAFLNEQDRDGVLINSAGRIKGATLQKPIHVGQAKGNTAGLLRWKSPAPPRKMTR